MSAQDVGAALRARREAAGLTQQDVAARAGLRDRKAVWRLEHDPRRVPLDVACRVADALGGDLAVGAPEDRRRTVLGYVQSLEERNRELTGKLAALTRPPTDELVELRVLVANLERELASARRQRDAAAAEVTAIKAALQPARMPRPRAGSGPCAVTPCPEVLRARAALDALARQPRLTHDLIDRARRAVAGRAVRPTTTIGAAA